MSRDKQRLDVVEFPKEPVLRHPHLFELSPHTSKEKEKSEFVKEETNDLTICKMDPTKDLQPFCDYVLMQEFHATSTHYGSTKILSQHRDGHLVGQKIDGDVDVAQPIQLAHFDTQDFPLLLVFFPPNEELQNCGEQQVYGVQASLLGLLSNRGCKRLRFLANSKIVAGEQMWLQYA